MIARSSSYCQVYRWNICGVQGKQNAQQIQPVIIIVAIFITLPSLDISGMLR